MTSSSEGEVLREALRTPEFCARWVVCRYRIPGCVRDNHGVANLFRDTIWETIGTQGLQVALQYDSADALTVSDVKPMGEHYGDGLKGDVSLT
jgi:hypothetical protein